MRKIRISVLSVAALAGVLFGFARSGMAQIAETSRKITAEERLDAIEQQSKILERRLESVEGKRIAEAASSSSQGGNDGTLQTIAGVEQIEALDQKLRIAERRRELEAETAAAQAKAAPLVGAGKDGFFLRSADNAFRLNLRGYIQADGRFSDDDTGRAGADTFVLRRIRPILEGTLFKNFGFRLMPDFGNGTTVLQDAYFDATILPWIKLRAGKYKGPVGLERLVSGSELLFVERAFPTSLVPNRDVGVQLYGEPWSGVVTYATGLFNGVPDGSSLDLDADNKKEFEGRFFAHPFRKTSIAPLQGLGVGVSGTLGNKEGTASSPNLASYRTTGQQIFFRYHSDGTPAGTVVADGKQYRISPQAYYYSGPFGLLGEYVLSSQQVKRGTLRGSVDNVAWQVAASYVLTGEKASYRSVTPAHPLERSKGRWGAFEIAGRYTELRADRGAFPIFADPQNSVRGARAWALGLNWYFNKNARFVFNYEQTDLTGISGGRKKKDEKAFLHRFQVSF